MYTIGQAVARTGVSADTLRAWERRYGIPAPSRTDARYRLYDEDALGAIRRMTQLVGEGLNPREAARVVAGEAPAAGLSPHDFVTALTEDRPTDELERELARRFAGPLADAVDGWLLPMLDLLGEAWDCGDATLGAEHAISAAIMRQLAIVWNRLPEGESSPLVLVGLPAGARHEIAPFAFATLLRSSRMRVRYLGADLPPAGWASAVARERPCVVVTAAHRVSDVGPAGEVLEVSRAAGAGLVALGGRCQDDVAGVAVRLGHELGPAVARLMSLTVFASPA